MSTIERRAGRGEGPLDADALTLRPMTSSDLRAVVAIERASFTMAWSVGTFQSLLDRPDSEAWIAERGAELVGYAVYWMVLDEAELGDIAVRPDERRKGVGARLLRHVIRRARSRGARLLYLEVRESNLGAQELYFRHGFRATGRRRRYYVEPVEDALVLSLELDPGGPDRSGVTDF